MTAVSFAKRALPDIDGVAESEQLGLDAAEQIRMQKLRHSKACRGISLETI